MLNTRCWTTKKKPVKEKRRLHTSWAPNSYLMSLRKFNVLGLGGREGERERGREERKKERKKGGRDRRVSTTWRKPSGWKTFVWHCCAVKTRFQVLIVSAGVCFVYSWTVIRKRVNLHYLKLLTQEAQNTAHPSQSHQAVMQMISSLKKLFAQIHQKKNPKEQASAI